VGLIHLVTYFIYFAIGLSLGLIATDNFDHLLRVTLGHLGDIPSLSLRVRRYGGDQQDGNKSANGRVVRQRENQAARRQSKSRAIHACRSSRGVARTATPTAERFQHAGGRPVL